MLQFIKPKKSSLDVRVGFKNYEPRLIFELRPFLKLNDNNTSTFDNNNKITFSLNHEEFGEIGYLLEKVQWLNYEKIKQKLEKTGYTVNESNGTQYVSKGFIRPLRDMSRKMIISYNFKNDSFIGMSLKGQEYKNNELHNNVTFMFSEVETWSLLNIIKNMYSPHFYEYLITKEKKKNNSNNN